VVQSDGLLHLKFANTQLPQLFKIAGKDLSWNGANDLITILVALECLSLCLYLLSGYTKKYV
jgi:NADH:ubiquinone oxidoreductase subunit 2 (subunit N)